MTISFQPIMILIQISLMESSRFLESINSYSINPNGSVVYTYQHFAGQMNLHKCTMYCGCHSFTFAGHTGALCFCGNDPGTSCDIESCMDKIDVSGFVSTFDKPVVSHVDQFENVSLDITEVSGIEKYGVVIDERVMEFHTRQPLVSFVEPGIHSIAVEPGVFIGCQSEPHTITVHIKPNISISCNEATPFGEEIECDIQISGTDLSELSLFMNDEEILKVNSFAEPHYYSVGGKMQTDRYEDYMESYRWDAGNEHNATINPNHQFHTHGVVRAFEAHITRLNETVGYSCINFMIVKPFCLSDDGRYCPRESVCGGFARTTCDDGKDADDPVEYSTYYSDGTDTVWCMEPPKYTNVGNFTYAAMRELEQIGAYYSIEYVFTGYAYHLGHNVFPVPSDESFEVKPGHFLGWHPCFENPADVGYYGIDPVEDEMYSQYEYRDVATLTLHGAFTTDMEFGQVSPHEHMVRAHVEAATRIRENFTVDEVVGTEIKLKAQLSSDYYGMTIEATDTTLITEEIANLTIESEENIEVNKPLTLYFKMDKGSDVIYCVNWGDRTDSTQCLLTTTSSTVNYTYKIAGPYSIFVKAYNTLNTVNTSRSVNVVSINQTLEFVDNIALIPPAATGQDLENDVIVFGSGNNDVIIIYTHANGSSQTVNFTANVTQYMVITVQKKFYAPEDILVSTTIGSALSNVTIGSYGSVEDPIVNIELDTNTTGATFNQSLFQIFEHQGTNVTYIWQWNEAEVDVTTYIREINHTFYSFGNKTINITAYNKVSEVNRSFVYEVQDTIFGLELVGETHIFTEFTKPSIILFKLNEGTGVECWINYNTTDALLSPVAADMDIVNDSSYLIAYGNYTYLEKGIYNVSVYCENDVSNISLSHLMPVEDKITDFVTEFRQNYEGDLQYENDGFYDWVEVNETVNITVSVSNEGEVWFVYDAGDGRPNVTTTNRSYTFSYPEWSDKLYVMVITAFNRVDRVNHTNYTWVPRPVENMTGFHILHEPENSTEKMELNLMIETGDFFNCTWDFGDGSPTELVTYDMYLENQAIVLHQFAADENLMLPGMYNVSANCSNRLYTDNASAIVKSYNPVSNFLVDFYSECEGKNRTGGFGLRGDLFPIDCDVIFVVSEQLGTNVSYLFDFGYINETTGEMVTSLEYDPTKPLEEVRHRFMAARRPQDSKWVFNVKILANNTVSLFEKIVKVQVISSISSFTIKDDGDDVFVGGPANIYFSVESIGYEGCYLIDMGDSTLPVMFGDETCTSKDAYLAYKYLSTVDVKPLTTLLVYTHSYDFEDLYTVTVTGVNLVSEFKATINVKVIDYPCDPPELRWASAMADEIDLAKVLAPFYKCRRYLVLTKAVPNCLKPNTTILRTWSLKRVKDNNDVAVHEVFEMPEGAQRYVIDERSLNYGIYHIQLNGSMFHNDSGRFVPETLTILNGYFSIKQCPLFPLIAGGTGSAVGRNGSLVIDGSGSYDPDVMPGLPMNLKFKWFCRRLSETFPAFEVMDTVLVKYPATPLIATTNHTLDRSSFHGCFGTGIGKLNVEGLIGSTLTLEKKYMLYKEDYIILMHISQDGRNDTALIEYHLRILEFDPPIVSVKCKLNCLLKKNPTQKMSLIAKCDNCGNNPAIYKWKMFALNLSAVDNPLINATHNLSMCASTDIQSEKNLVMPAYTLETVQCLHIGFQYYVVLFTYWGNDSSKINEDQGGFAQYTIDVNSPPDITNAQAKVMVMLDNGTKLPEAHQDLGPHFALETRFVIDVTGVEDIDVPLTYNFFYLPTTGNHSGQWKSATFPSEGSPSSEPFTLPAGSSDHDYLIRIRVTVSDTFLSTSEGFYVEVPVQPKVLTMDIVRAMLKDPKILYDSAALGNVFGGLLDSLGDPTSTLPNDEVKALMTEMLPMIEIDSAATAAMVASVLDGASDEKEEPLTDEQLAHSMETTKKMAQFASELTPEQLEAITKQTLAASAKFTGVLSGNNSADNLKAAMESESQMTSGSSGNMIAGERPTPIKTANGKTQVLCVQGPSAVGAFQLPDLRDSKDDDCLGTTNSDNTKNRYSFADEGGVSAVHGNTIGLTLTQPPAPVGNKRRRRSVSDSKTVAGLAEPIRITIPHQGIIPAPTTYNAYCELMRIVHLVECNTNETNLILKVRPFFDNFTGNFFVFLNKGTAPSLVDHEINCTLPNPYPENWDDLSYAKKLHFEVEEKWRCFIEKEVMNNLCTGRWCAGVVYYTNTTNRTTILKDRDFPVEEAKCAKVNYTFLAYSRACLWWRQDVKNWAGAGCNVSRETKDNETICYCDHLTDFGGGGPFPEPNPIDFGAAFSGFANLGDNPTVFSTVMGIFGVFLILLIWARKNDKSDMKKKQVCHLSDNHPNDTYFYEILVKTGNKSGGSSTADVYIMIKGSEGETAPRKLNSNKRKFFQKGEVDIFLLAVPFSLGKLFEIEVFHNNTGESPGWHLAQVEIIDMQTKNSWNFVVNQWLDITEEDGEINRKIALPDPEYLKDFSYVFGETLQRNLYDGHIWLSLFTKLPQSPYTRVQRLCTCLSLLLTNMLANAMFYEAVQEGPPPFLVNMGPFIISLEQVQIAFTSALIVVPAHLLIVTFYKKSGPEMNREEAYEVHAGDDTDETDIPEVITEKSDENAEKVKEKSHETYNRRVEFLKSILFPGSVDKEIKKPLPYWLKYIAHFFVFVTSVVSAFFIILYGFQFGHEKSIKWLTCFLLSFLVSLFLVQPGKVVVLSLLFALIVKEPPKILEAVEIYGTGKKKIKDEELESQVQELVKLPDAKRLQEIKEQRIKEKIIKAIVKESLVQSLFVVLFIFVCYAAVDPNAYLLGESVHKLMGDNGITGAYFGGKAYMLEDIEPDGKSFRNVQPASGISNRLEWFDWARYSVVEYLFMNNWYNKKKYALGYIADNQQSKILAMARFRQNRIKRMSCTKHPVFEYLIVECNAGYSSAAEQTKSFSKGWEPALNYSTKIAARKGLRKALYLGYEDPWRFQTASELKNFPYWGRFATYGGDSYSVSIGPKKRVAKKVMKEMKDNFWVDRYTRAIFTEANIYNAHTNLLLVVTFLHEILPTGGWYCMINIQSLRLYRYVGGFGEWTMLFDIIFVIVTLVGLYKIIRESRRSGFKVYLSNFWSLLHFIIIICSLLAIAMTFGRFFAVKQAIQQYMKEPELFVSFGYVTQMENLISACLGFALFFANLEFLRILRFNKSVGQMTKTMKILGSPLASFGLTFIIIFMAYVSFTHCLYADKLEKFRDVKNSFVALTMMFMGSFDIYAFLDNAPILGPIMFFSYMMAIQMIMINMFVGIICDAFAEVGEMEPEEQPSVLSFMANRVKNPGSTEEPIYSDWKDEWELMMDAFNDQSDNCLFLLRNFETEELRHAKWFEVENTDDKRDNGLTAVLGSDFFEDDSEFIDGLNELQQRLKSMTPGQAKIFLNAAAIRRQSEKHNESDSNEGNSSAEENESDAS